MCVKSQRLDVASICLGKMGHAAGARAMRQISSQNVDKDVKTAVLAVHLVILKILMLKLKFARSYYSQT